MSILLSCPGCFFRLRAPDDRAGTNCRCPNCGSKVRVPGPVREERIRPRPGSHHAPRDEPAMEMDHAPRDEPAMEMDHAERDEPAMEEDHAPRDEPIRPGSNPFALPSFFLSLAALVVVFLMPCLGWLVSLPLAALGVAFGLAGISTARRERAGLGLAITGLLLGLAAFVPALMVSQVLGKALAKF